MAEGDTGTFLIISLCAVLIINGVVSMYMTANMVPFSSQATIYPPVKVLYSEFNGSTTNFSAFDEDGLKAIANLTLEVTGYGKVVLDGVTDLMADKDEHNIIDVDANAQFAANSISIDTGKLSSLRKSASVFIYVPGLENPRVLVDGYVCPPTICQVAGYVNGTLVFRVPQFSNSYSAEETPVTQPPAPPGGAE